MWYFISLPCTRWRGSAIWGDGPRFGCTKAVSVSSFALSLNSKSQEIIPSREERRKVSENELWVGKALTKQLINTLDQESIVLLVYTAIILWGRGIWRWYWSLWVEASEERSHDSAWNSKECLGVWRWLLSPCIACSQSRAHVMCPLAAHEKQRPHALDGSLRSSKTPQNQYRKNRRHVDSNVGKL